MRLSQLIDELAEFRDTYGHGNSEVSVNNVGRVRSVSVTDTAVVLHPTVANDQWVSIVNDDMVAGTVNHAFEAFVDQCYRSMMDANGATPYVHAEYERWDEMLKAALVLLTNGDMPYARALRWAFTDSGSDIRHLLSFSQGDRHSMCYEAGEMSREDYEATLRWAVECEEDGETWVDAFATREQAEQHAAAFLKANTKVVDRHAS